MAFTERLAVVIDATGIGAVSEFQKVGRVARVELAKADKAIDGTRAQGGLLDKALNKMGLSSIDAGAALKTGLAAGAGVAAVAITKLAADGVREFTALGQKVRDFDRISGAGAETSSRFVSVLDDMGVEAEVGAKALSRFARELDPSKLDKFGVSIIKTKDGTTDLVATFAKVATAYANTDDAGEKARLRFELFGKQGDALIPILEKGGAALQQMFANVPKGELFDQKKLDQVENYRLALDRFDDAVKNVERSVGSKLVGPVTDVANGLAFLAEKATDGESGLSKVAGGAANLARGIPAVGVVVDGVIPGLRAMGQHSSDAAKAQQELEGKFKDAARAAEEEASVLERLNQGLIASFSDALGLEGALDRLVDANGDVTKAQAEYNEALRVYGANSQQARDASNRLGDALRDAKGDYLDVADAAVKLADHQAEANGRQLTAAERTDIYKAKLQELLNQLAPDSPLRQALQGWIDQLNSIPGSIETRISASTQFAPGRVGATGVQQRSQIPLRAHGGPVDRGLYIVGEQGPELLQMGPGAGGYVYPNNIYNRVAAGLDATRRAGGGPVGYIQAEDGSWVPPSFYSTAYTSVPQPTLDPVFAGGGIIIQNLNVTSDGSPEDIARAVRAELLKLQRRGISPSLS